MGAKRFKMGKSQSGAVDKEELTLAVDNRGRVTLLKEARDQLGSKANDEIPATLIGSVLEVNLKPSSELETATTGHDTWENTTPTDAGETLFGPIDQ